jgi:hypothetical protein
MKPSLAICWLTCFAFYLGGSPFDAGSEVKIEKKKNVRQYFPWSLTMKFNKKNYQQYLDFKLTRRIPHK